MPVIREGLERVTIVKCYGPGRYAGVYKIRRQDGTEETRSGPEGLEGEVTVRLLRIEGIGPEKRTLRIMETST